MSEARARRPRLEEVAERARVSKSIASRVLNGDPTVSVRDDTRERVLAAARELAYRPHPVARALASSEMGALALLVPAFDNPAYTDVIRGAFHRARERGYVLLAAEDFEGQQADEAFTDLVEAGRIDGLLIASALPAPPLLAALERHWVPHVFVNRAVPGAVANVVLDVGRASELAVEFLVGLGHRRLAHVAGPAEIESAKRREDDFVEAARREGIEPVVVRAPFSEADGDDAARRLLTDHPDVTALYVSSFGQSVGVLRAAAALGRHIPDDLSLLSFENVPLADYTMPPLTTLAMPMRQLGETSVDILLEQIAGAPPEIHQLPTEPRIVIRQSTRPPA
ncbi:MAG: LacI family transcriptional regulator [Solirubrobacteraceae bacterium]